MMYSVGSKSAIHSMSAIDADFPITAKDIGKATLSDQVLVRLLNYAMSGWPESCAEADVKLYKLE